MLRILNVECLLSHILAENKYSPAYGAVNIPVEELNAFLVLNKIFLKTILEEVYKYSPSSASKATALPENMTTPWEQLYLLLVCVSVLLHCYQYSKRIDCISNIHVILYTNYFFKYWHNLQKSRNKSKRWYSENCISLSLL